MTSYKKVNGTLLGKLRLIDKDKHTITNGRQLTDIHISALLKIKFPLLNALQSTCYQSKKRLKMAENMLLVINVGTNHWAVFSTCSSPLHSHRPDEAP